MHKLRKGIWDANIMNDKSVRIWKEEVMAYVKALSRHMAGWTEETRE
jgi:hypothetical protein